jgi:hypothetical protein
LRSFCSSPRLRDEKTTLILWTHKKMLPFLILLYLNFNKVLFISLNEIFSPDYFFCWQTENLIFSPFDSRNMHFEFVLTLSNYLLVPNENSENLFQLNLRLFQSILDERRFSHFFSLTNLSPILPKLYSFRLIE